MPWYLQWSDSIKKRACRYLLQRYLGQFLEEKLTLDQLSVNIYSGIGSVSNVCLDVQALNDLGAEKNLPIEFVDGFISEISVSIPWANLFADSIFVEVTGMQITIQPKQRPDNAASMLESMWSSMASSIQLAAECLKQESLPEEKDDESENNMEGLEIFAHAIESILTRVKIKLKDTCIRLEHLPKEGKNGIALEIKIKNIEYCDETSCQFDMEADYENAQKTSTSFSTKKFHCDGISFYSDEFPLEKRTFSRSITFDKSKPNQDSILIGKLSGSQEISLKLKLDSLAHGPKVELELSLGSFTFFLSPRQLYLLVEVLQSLASPHIQDTSNVASRKGIGAKIMSSNDFKKVEQDLQETFTFPTFHLPPMNTGQSKGWSSPSFDETEDEFHPMKLTNVMSGSTISNNTTDTSYTSYSSTYMSKPDLPNNYDYSYSSNNSFKSKKYDRGFFVDSDTLEDTSAFHIRITSFAAVLLHEDILTFSHDTFELTSSSTSTMKNLANQFFGQLGRFTLAGNKDFEASKAAFVKACSLNHIRVLGAAIIIEGNDAGNFNNSVFSTVISAANLELLECLVENNSTSTGEPQYVELLKFMKGTNTDVIEPHFRISNQPDIRIHIQQSKRHQHSRKSSKFKMAFNLEQCWTEVDLSIFDRISTITNYQSLCQLRSSPREILEQPPSFHQEMDNTVSSEKSFSFKVQSPFLVVKFRFPIPDLRPVHEKGRFPWWQRSVRKDVLYLNLLETSFCTDLNLKTPFQEYHLSCKEVTLLFKEGNTETAIPLVHASRLSSNGSDVQPRLLVRLHPIQPLPEEEEITEKEDNGLSYSTYMETPAKDPSPFLSKKVVHGSDTYHSSTNDDELVIPSLKKDMNNFINHASENAKVQVEIVLPYLCVEFPTKHLYEIIYNRILSDLSLWQTSSSQQKDKKMSAPVFPYFSMCKSGIQVSDDSDDEERTYKNSFKNPSSFNRFNQSNLSLKVHISKGVLNICPNLKDKHGNISNSKVGEIYFNLTDASIFAVTYFKGKPQQNYICFQVSTIDVYHKADVEVNTRTRGANFASNKAPPEYLEPILLQSNKEIKVTSLNPEGSSGNMFTVAISTNVNERRMKTIRIACSLSNATLKHRVTPSNYSWLTQFMDFFDVVDYPVKGYDSPQVITELHLHAWDSAIDYRPLNLPICCVVTLGNLSISSNIAARTKTSTLRFIAEEGSLFISENVKGNLNPNLKADYVSVIELGLFEISLRLSDQINFPKIDFKASNNKLHIRTCADSACALANLIKYYAFEGDLKDQKQKEAEKSTLKSSPPETKEIDPSLTQSTVVRVNDMMEDAMKEISSHTQDEIETASESLGSDVDLFYFPDEGIGQQSQPVDWGDCEVELDHDFCLLENEVGCNFISENGRPEVRILTERKIQIIENHFNIVLGKTDQLVSPKYYPTPIYKYTLTDLNIVWHMYGGNDFTAQSSNKKNVKFKSDDSSPKETTIISEKPDSIFPGVYYESNKETVDTKLSNNQENFKKSSNKKLNWQKMGGPGREHDVLMEFQFNKVKYQHEIYPEKTTEASRQVLLVHEFEIRDKLSSSQINKFLYQYCSEANPKQCHANMVVIKAVHLRPDSRRNIQETCLRVSLLPLRLNIDQDSLQFLVNFFTQLSGLTTNSQEVAVVNHVTPVMEVKGAEEITEIKQEENHSDPKPTPKSHNSTPSFIRNFIFSPDVPIRIDYVGKHVDLSHGPLAGLLMGLGQLSCLQIKLKKINCKHGLLGFDKLLSYILSEWIRDIKKTQFPCLIGGVGPMHALVQLFQGIRDLFWLPIEQYQKDGRIVRGLQRGANSFTTSTAIAALELTARIVQAIQSIAEAAFDMVSPGPSVRRLHGSIKQKKQHFSHPADIREGVANAYTLVKQGLGETAETLVRVASAEAEQKGAVGAVGGVLRQIPPTVVAPIILASAATSNLLGGVRSQLAPDTRREATNKWKNSGNDKNLGNK